MADFKQAYKKMQVAEYSGKEYLFLHYLSDEFGYTIGGIYQNANPNAIDWKYIDNVVKSVGDIRRASKMLYNDEEIQLQIFNYFRKHYWDKSNLSELLHQKVAEEIYMASVLYGVERAVKMAQKIAQVKQDGILGKYSAKGINNVNEHFFDELYDVLEIQLAESIATKYHKEHYLNGWKARAKDSWDIKV